MRLLLLCLERTWAEPSFLITLVTECPDQWLLSPQATSGGTGLPAALQADVTQQLIAMAAAEKSTVVRAQIDTVIGLQKHSSGGTTAEGVVRMES